jgi:hypothetical protein
MRLFRRTGVEVRPDGGATRAGRVNDHRIAELVHAPQPGAAVRGARTRAGAGRRADPGSDPRRAPRTRRVARCPTPPGCRPRRRAARHCPPARRPPERSRPDGGRADEPAGAPTELRVRQRQLVESESGAVQRRPESRKRASKQANTPYAPPGPGSRGRAPGARVSPRQTRRGRAQRPQAVLVSNNPYEGGDIAGLSRRARLDQGVLGGGDRASSGRTDPSIERPIEEVAAALPHGPGAVG